MPCRVLTGSAIAVHFFASLLTTLATAVLPSRPRPTQRVRRGWAGRAGRRRGTEGQGGESERRGLEPPPPNVHTPHCRAPGHSRAPTGPAMEPNRPARERVCPRACAAARPGKERAPHTGQAGHTRSTARQHAPRHKNTTPPRQTPTPDDERAAKNKPKPRSPHSATAAVRMDVCAPGSEPSPCRLRTSRRPDGRVCARQ